MPIAVAASTVALVVLLGALGASCTGGFFGEVLACNTGGDVAYAVAFGGFCLTVLTTLGLWLALTVMLIGRLRRAFAQR